MVRVGIIGLGQMGLLHGAITNSLPNGKLVAFCDNNSRLTRIGSKILPNVHFYTDYLEMIEREALDALFVCSSTPSHAPILSQIRNKLGKIGLFVEKPLATTSFDAMHIANEYRNLPNVTMVGFQKRFAGPFRKAKELLEMGVLGKPSFFTSHFYTSENFGEGKGWKFEKDGGGATLDFGPHIIDMLLWFFKEPKSIMAKRKSVFSANVEDYVHVIMDFDENLSGYADICWSMRNFNPGELMIEVHGSKGSLNMTEDRLILYLDNDVPDFLPAGVHMLTASSLIPEVPYLLAHPENVLEDDYFLRSVESNAKVDCNFESSAKVNLILDKIRNS